MPATLVTIDTRTCLMRRYEGRKLTNKVLPTDVTKWPLSASYIPAIEALRRDPSKVVEPTSPEAA